LRASRALSVNRLNGFARGSLDLEERPPRVTRHARSRLITLGSCAKVARGGAISLAAFGNRSIGPRSLALVTHLLPVFALVSRSLRIPVALAVPFSLITFPHACRKRDRHQLSVDFSIFARRFHVVIREIACASRDSQPLSKFSRLTSIRNEAIPRGGFTRHVAFQIAISFRRSPTLSLIPSRIRVSLYIFSDLRAHFDSHSLAR